MISKQRFLLIGIALLFGIGLRGQVTVTGTAVKQAGKRIRVSFVVLTERGFHVYADNSLEGVAGPVLVAINETVNIGKINAAGKILAVKDSIFDGRKVFVYKDKVVLETTFEFKTAIPAVFNGILKLLVGNGKEFKGMEIPVEIKIPC